MKGAAMSSTPRRRARRRAGLIAGVVLLVETAGLWLRTRRIGGQVIVRCGAGHLFTTIWIPAASVKSVRLGWWRFQRCPVGRHFSLVTPVNPSDLTDEERRFAREHHDIKLP
jgi:hypothetical protein